MQPFVIRWFGTLVLLVAATTAQAQGNVVLVAGDDPSMDALTDALQVQLAGEWTFARTGAPAGETPLQRASEAQQAATRAGARATIWVETGPEGGAMIRVVEAEGEVLRHAPLPAPLGTIEGRTFATVVASLLDELEAPPQRIRVRVRVEVESEDGTFVVDDADARVVTPDGREVEASLESADATPEPEPEAEAPVVVVVPEESSAAPEVAPGPQTAPQDGRHHVVGVDFAPWLGMSSTRAGRGTRNLSFGVVGALSGGIEGIGVSSAVNVVDGDTEGALVAGGLNLGLGELEGAMVAAGGNIVTGEMEGAQVAAGFNYAHRDVTGAQASAGANIIAGDLEGGQFSAGANWVHGSFVGAQLSAGLNVARGRAFGLQAGSLNFARGGGGAQVGVVNVQRGHFDGVQVGMLNISEDADFSLGLVNVVTKEGRSHLRLEVNTEGFGMISFLHGGPHWHYIYSVGGRAGPGDAEDDVFAVGMGLGGHITPHERVFLDVDLMSYYLHDDTGTEDLPNENGAEILGQLRLTLGVKLMDWFAIVGGISLNALTTYQDESTYGHVATEVYDDGDWRVQLYPSASLGLQFF